MMAEKYERGGGQHCCVVGCANNRKAIFLWHNSTCQKHGKPHRDCVCPPPFSLHGLPKDQDLQRQWKASINRKTLPKTVLVCSQHFVDGKPTKKNPIPQLNMGYGKTLVKSTRKSPAQRPFLDQHPIPSQNIPKLRKIDLNSEHEEIDTVLPTAPSKMNACANGVAPNLQDAATQWNDEENDHTYAKYNSQAHTRAEKGVQCSTEQGLMSVARLETDSDSVLYTGVNLSVFRTLVECMEPFKNPSFTLNLGDQILATLMKLKLDLVSEDIARRFGISASYVSKIINFWIPKLAAHLKDLIVWLPRELIRATLPSVFKDDYPKTTCIIDCAEVFLQKPKNLKTRGETYSQYKSHNTLKFLVAISPHGQIMFMSHAYGGRASDKFIVKDSGFLNYLLPNDEVMADRGFTINDELFPLRVKLNIPAFTQGKKLSDEDATRTRRIARVRIHVERAIRRLKNFQILSGIVKISMNKSIDDILIICAALCNLQSDLIRE